MFIRWESYCTNCSVTTCPYRVADLSIAQAVRVVCDERPRKPSTTDSRLRGDLETIITKSLEKDRGKRYGSAAALAEDVRRHLSGDAILARPPSLTYQLRILARRNRVAFTSAAIVALSLVVATVVSTNLYLEARRASTEALRKQRQSDAVASFLSATLDTIDEITNGAPDTVETMLETATRRLEAGELADQPLVEAAVRMRLGSACESRVQYEHALKHRQTAHAIYRRELGEESPEALYAGLELGQLLTRFRRFREAETIARATLDTWRRLYPATDERVLEALALLGESVGGQGRLAEASDTFRDILEIRLQTKGEESNETLLSMRALSGTLLAAGKVGEAEEPGHAGCRDSAARIR